ncbi:alpha/beta hydrolase [Staphylococcus cohnii species complex 1658]|uniref:alpha/beta hydrolase n=1 Tax=Staphylococcus cohnii species complex 1658 TaxID=3239424 RepID=UPI0034D95B37
MKDSELNLVDKDLQEAAQSMQSDKLTMENLQSYRDNVLSHAKTNIDSHLDVILEKHRVPYKDIEVPIILFRPNQATDTESMPVYIYIHGGGMVSGGAHLDNEDNAFLAHELECIVISIDYRLAPETIFPGQLEDCYAVLKWVKNNADDLNIDDARIAIGGSSAGGGLAASLAQLALDRNEVNIIFQNLHIPMLDDRTVFKSQDNFYTDHLGWNRQMNAFAWQMYLGGPTHSMEPDRYAVPARRDNLENLPPTLITIGSLDLFVEEAMTYAHRLMLAGVSTELHVYPGLYHLGELIPGTRIHKKLLNDRLYSMKRAFYD